MNKKESIKTAKIESQKTESQDKVFSFKEFREKNENFYLIFLEPYKADILSILREKDPKLADKLKKNIKEIIDNDYEDVQIALTPVMEEMYQAYVILKENFSNEDLGVIYWQ